MNKLYIIILIIIISASSCNNPPKVKEKPVEIKSVFERQADRELSERLERMKENRIKYKNAIKLQVSKITYNADYEAIYSFTVSNNYTETIVAFEIGTLYCKKIIKAKIQPKKAYSGNFKIDELNCEYDEGREFFEKDKIKDASNYRISSMILANGEKVNLFSFL